MEDVNKSILGIGEQSTDIDVSRTTRYFSVNASFPLGQLQGFKLQSRLIKTLGELKVTDEEKTRLLEWSNHAIDDSIKKLKDPHYTVKSDSAFHDVKVLVSEGELASDEANAVASCGIVTDEVAISGQLEHEVYMKLADQPLKKAKLPAKIKRSFVTLAQLNTGDNVTIADQSTMLAELQGSVDRLMEMLDDLNLSSQYPKQQSEIVDSALHTGDIALKISHKKVSGKLIILVNDDKVEFDDKEKVTPILRMIFEETDDLKTSVGISEIYEDYFECDYNVNKHDEEAMKERAQKKTQLYDLVDRANRKIRQHTTLKTNLIVDPGDGMYQLNPELKNCT